MMLRVGVVWPGRLDPWPDRSGQAPGLSGRPDRPAGLRQPCSPPSINDGKTNFTLVGMMCLITSTCMNYVIEDSIIPIGPQTDARLVPRRITKLKGKNIYTVLVAWRSSTFIRKTCQTMKSSGMTTSTRTRI